MGALYQDGQTWQLPQGTSQMGTERVPRQTEGISTDGFSCFHKSGISDELPNGSQQKLEHFSHWSEDSHPSRTVLWCEPCCVCQLPQEQVILLKLLQDWRNLLMAWIVPLDAGGTSWTKHFVVLVWFPRELSGVVLCSTQEYGTNDISLESRVRSQGDAASERILDPIDGGPATGKSVEGIINLFVHALFGTSGTEVDNVSWRDSERILKLVRKIGTMWPSQDKELVGWRTLKQDRALRSANKRLWMNWRRSPWNETRKKTSSALLRCIQCTKAFSDW